MNRREALGHIHSYQRRFGNRVGQAVRQVIEQFEEKFADRLAEAFEHSAFQMPFVGPLPEGTKFFYRTPALTCYVIEQPPRTRRISWLGLDDMTLAFPYVVFMCFVDEGGVPSHLCAGFRNTKLESLRDKVGLPCLPNIDGDFGVCLDAELSGTYGAAADAMLDYFWRSQFTQDWAENRQEYRGVPELSSLKRWQAATKANPFFPLKVNWRNPRSVQSIVARYVLTWDIELADTSRAIRQTIPEVAAGVWDEIKRQCDGVIDSKLDDELIQLLTGGRHE